jgi:hypothetical protein
LRAHDLPRPAQAPNAFVLPWAKPLLPFELVDHRDAPFVRRNLEGRWTLLLFGYAQCAEVCPTTLVDRMDARRRLAREPAAIAGAAVLVSVDPVRDTPARLAEYTGPFEPGLYWYHAHHHGRAQRQVMGGLSGGLVIDGLLDPLPQRAGITERVMLLDDIRITPQGSLPDDDSASSPSIRMVNGQINPTLLIRPSETQLLRIGNIGTDLYYRLKLDEHGFPAAVPAALLAQQRDHARRPGADLRGAVGQSGRATDDELHRARPQGERQPAAAQGPQPGGPRTPTSLRRWASARPTARSATRTTPTAADRIRCRTSLR